MPLFQNTHCVTREEGRSGSAMNMGLQRFMISGVHSPFSQEQLLLKVPLQLVCSLVCIRGNCGKALSLCRHLFRQPLCCSFWVQFNRREIWQWFRLCCHQGFEAFLLNLFLQLDTCWTVLRTLENAGRSRQQCWAIWKGDEYCSLMFEFQNYIWQPQMSLELFVLLCIGVAEMLL